MILMDQSSNYMVRALLLNRNVGHLMTNPSIILKDGSEIPEGIMDAFFQLCVQCTI